MVEENEVRAPLTHYERGRIAVIAAQQGAFAHTEAAVEKLFVSGSKAKRSKVRSFAAVFEERGDMLSHPEDLTERRGLQIAAALRLGAESKFRQILSDNDPATAEEEWALLARVIEDLEDRPRDVRRGGRPKMSTPKAGWSGQDTLHTSTRVTMRVERDQEGFVLRLKGRMLDQSTMESVMTELARLLERGESFARETLT